jgi:hypothetical protein
MEDGTCALSVAVFEEKENVGNIFWHIMPCSQTSCVRDKMLSRF